MSSTLSFAGQNNKWNTAVDAQHVVDAIKATQNLQCLKLEGNTLGVEAAEAVGDALAECPEFQRAHWMDIFTGRLKTEIPDALRHMFSGLIRSGAKLVELDLSDNALGPVGVEGMVEFMTSPACYSLQELRLNNNGLGVKGGAMLAKALLKLTENAKGAGTPLQLKVFIAGRNRLEKEGAKIYAELFTAVGTLEEVAMPQNGIFHEGIAALAKAFSQNPNLRVINLNDNTFTPKGAKVMAQYLPSMQNLEVINFGDCLVKTRGAIMLAKALTEGHVKLKELYLDSNEIKAEGGFAIADAVRNKQNLQKLMLDANLFGEDGKEALIHCLEEMDQARCLDTLEENEEPDTEESGEESKEEETDSEEDTSVLAEETKSVPTGNGISAPSLEIRPVKCTVSEFFEQPTAGRLLGLENSAPSLLVGAARTKAEGSTEENFINICFGYLMRVASLSLVSNNEVQEKVHESTDELAKAIFGSAETNDLVSIATNSLLVHLGLLKCEDKTFKVEWDLKSCLVSLTSIVSQPYFPRSTKDALQVFLSRPHPQIDIYMQEKHNLMKVLFR